MYYPKAMREFSLYQLKSVVILESVHNLSIEGKMLVIQSPLDEILLEFCSSLIMLKHVQYTTTALLT